MELKGEQHILREPDVVWAALNDPELLKASIPGCETIDLIGENEYALVMVAAIGPVKARFKGKMLLSDIQPPQSYKITFEGSGGAAGFGKGQAAVQLAPAEAEGEGTLLTYQASAQVGGKIAQVGSRLVDGVAAKMAAEFFTRFKAALTEPGEGTEEEAKAAGGSRWKFWNKSSS